MKTSSLYGLLSALSGAFLLLILYFLGYHSDPVKFVTAKWIQGILGLAIGVTFIALGIRARRDEAPAGEGFTYGQALGTGVLVSVVSSFLSAIFYYCYAAFINPAFPDVQLQSQVQQMQAKGLSDDQISKAEAAMRFFGSPAIGAVFSVILGIIFGVILALIIAIFFKKPAPPRVATT